MKKTVMIVEDEISTRRFLAKSFTRHNYNVVEASNGLDALDEVKKRLPDVILLDVNMPKMNGFDFLKAIKNDPATEKVPVIMLTIRKDRKDLDKGLSLGVDFYLPKPFTFENVSEFVNLIV